MNNAEATNALLFAIAAIMVFIYLVIIVMVQVLRGIRDELQQIREKR